MIKIVSGKYRSRVIAVPPKGTVPTKNMVREGISNALNEIIPNSNCLDLFAGSGALGLEMLSRGAKYVLFVDASKEAIEIIKGNLSSLKENNASLFLGDYLDAIRENKGPYDIIFLDPPYIRKDFYVEATKEIIKNNILKEGGALIMEYEGELPLIEEHFTRIKDYKYGRSKVRILWR